MNTSVIVKDLKEHDQDFEFYPTTTKIIRTVYSDMIRSLNDYDISLLDIGAGNGNVFNIIDGLITYDEENKPNKKLKKYAIEKSSLLCQQMPSDIFVIGTDFQEQTLLDKDVDVIFCNPPYSDFKTWTKKIFSEANAQLVYMVIPSRWADDDELKDILNKRTDQAGLGWKVLGSFNFLDSEYRKARANVDIIKVQFKGRKYRDGYFDKISDPFDFWFEENFKINADKVKSFGIDRSGATTDFKNVNDIAKGKNLIEVLAELYQDEMQRTISTYKKLEELDRDVLKALKADFSGVKESLKMKIRNMKNDYWRELFNHLDKLTERLTHKSRESLLGTLTDHTSVDFTVKNAYAVVIWAIKNANKYMDDQLCDVYERITDQKNLKEYKSNDRIYKDCKRFRYEQPQGNVSHYILDYRLVVDAWGGGFDHSWRMNNRYKGLTEETFYLLQDIGTIANNLGFWLVESPSYFEWSAGEKVEFTYQKGTERKSFMTVRVYQKGSVHLKLNQDFMRKFNIEAARLNKWIKTPQDLANETDIPLQEIQKHFRSNFQLQPTNVGLLPEKVT